ncbi:error-prone DNA polymerase [Telmatobacter sp. DSM 110680]|uniref:Error-prone DNA polymerase n=1 Tax=Telmatobacter sp. DSM 110680 TaxID=3036704 RepID=A0AAU7DEP8_9BACT
MTNSPSITICKQLARNFSDEYIELHSSSAFSFLSGSSEPESIVERAVELDMPAIALADRNGLYGVARFHTAARHNKIKAHIGAEIAISPFGNRLAPSEWLPHRCPDEPPRIVLLCSSQVGYQNLCQLITRFKMRESTKAEGSATLDDLEEFSAGLICLTGGEEGLLASALSRKGEAGARAALDRLTSIYGRSNVYIELQRHCEREEEFRNVVLVNIASQRGIPLVATNGVRCATPEDRELLDIFTSIRHHTTVHNAGRLLSKNSLHHLRSAQEMSYIFCDIPEAIANTRVVSERLEFTLNDLGYKFPQYPVPNGETMDSFLAKRVDDGVRKRYANKLKRSLMERARLQAQHELALIARLGFAGYFLIVWDIIRFCQKNGFLVQGRGSAANSVVCFALEITAVDPIGMQLLFERFLSESRGELPDIDLDLPSGDHRELVIQHIYEHYGALGAAMTANVITYRGRSAAREVGKALGFDEQQVAKLSSLVGHWEWRGANDTMEKHFGQAGYDIRHPIIAKYLDLSMRVCDLPRHLGQHSGGMVICAGMLNRVVPIERASMPGRTVVQWDKEDCADMGLIKVDLLGLGMMATLKDSLELIPRHYGAVVDLALLPEDPVVYETLCKGDTVGMFQVESRAQMASLPHNAPRCFYDVVVQVAIIRPGPIVGKMMHPYMRRRQGQEEVSYPHPLLEPVLKRTLGVPLFQEQLLRMAMVVASFTGSEAEELRRAVGMRRSMQRMRDLEGRLRSGMTRNGIGLREQDNIVQGISSFAMYGFPESHAASFALIAYASAYLKVHYLAAFTCGLLNNQPMGFYSPAVLIKDAQRHGLRVRPICVQRSDWLCSIEHEPDDSLSLRIGLNYAKGLKQSSAESLLASRNTSGQFQSVDDLTQRIPELSRKELVLLAQIGALNSVGQVMHRRDALWQVEQAGRPIGPLLRSAIKTQNSKALIPLRQMTTDERLAADYAGCGLTCGPHPMTYHRDLLKHQDFASACDLARYSQNQFVKIAGCVIARQRPGTAKGFVFLSLEDETGITNIIITPDLFEQERMIITRSRFLAIEGRLQIQNRVIHVKAFRIRPIDITSADVSSHDFH